MSESLDVLRDVPYSDEKDNVLRSFDLYYAPDSSPQPLICFVHGGAWRSEDKADHASLARSLASSTGFPIAIPNYRLTNSSDGANSVRHPIHSQDVLDFLSFLQSWDRLGHVVDRSKIYLIGHSCSAHMLSSIFLDSSAVTPVLVPPPQVIKAVRGIILSEGIYDIDLLLSRFPTYREWFIAPAFGDKSSYPEFSATRLGLRKGQEKNDIRWLVIHSKGDTLVDLPQTDAMYTHLLRLYSEHAPQPVMVSKVDDLVEEHDQVLRSEGYLKLISDFILQDVHRA
ncbi:alpha/beta-hydrolase [Dendrothele bispora CBS 962.96]|uniref:Alpha/beta-hydrolase n=1 Tax=Dendrothele bispora (strain CBS 962.96) TaxID=1314807 RepID=A0A4S8LCK0_DENBC|nr:alpha/beta-hydrolase [Dendrothele bispora CBS 962.96]